MCINDIHSDLMHRNHPNPENIFGTIASGKGQIYHLSSFEMMISLVSKHFRMLLVQKNGYQKH